MGATTPSTVAATTITTSGQVFLSNTGATTASKYSQIQNTGAQLIFGIETSAGGAVLVNGSPYAAVFSNQASYPVQIGSGNTLVASFSSTGLAVTGAVTATGNITAYYSSDSRLKENIVPIQNALVKIDQITGVNFDWTQDYINRNGGTDSMFLRKNTIGVIAQEIEKVLPEAVADRPDGFKAVRYELIVPLLIQAIKELKSELNELNSKLNK